MKNSEVWWVGPHKAHALTFAVTSILHLVKMTCHVCCSHGFLCKGVTYSKVSDCKDSFVALVQKSNISFFIWQLHKDKIVNMANDDTTVQISWTVIILVKRRNKCLDWSYSAIFQNCVSCCYTSVAGYVIMLQQFPIFCSIMWASFKLQPQKFLRNKID